MTINFFYYRSSSTISIKITKKRSLSEGFNILELLQLQIITKFIQMKKYAFIAIAILLLLSGSCSQPAKKAAHEAYQWPETPEVVAKLKEWHDWKFGIIIHWGAYSEWGVVESWSLCPEDEPWCERRGPHAADYHSYVKAYEEIRYEFYPSDFDPQKWAQACHDAGVKYLVFTAKHHDGFCMYDSKYTNYKITDHKSAFSNHPSADITRAILDAFRQKEMHIGIYFSKADWHHDDYWWPYFPAFDRNVNYDPQKYPERWQRFQEFTFLQIEELMRDYGKVDILWLDGGWVRPENTLTEETRPWLGKNQWIQDINMPAIANMARHYQPGLLIVDRTVHGEYENYRTPEQQIPLVLPPYPWESCITLGDSWYHSGEGERYKSFHWAIHTLVQIVAKGGNLLLGVGPDKTGNLAPEVYQRLHEIGQWIKTNGAAIYETRPIPPYQSGNWCFTQSKNGDTVYAIYLINDQELLPNTLTMPSEIALQSNLVELLGQNEPLKAFSENQQWNISLPQDLINELSQLPALVFRIKK